MNKEELIIQKLIKIVANQQKILRKLAQIEPPTEKRDENIDYITHNLVPIVASNLGLKGISVAVDTPSGVPGGGDAGGYVAPQPGTYRALISGVPKNREQQFADAMIKQINAQKPELAKIFNYSFQ